MRQERTGIKIDWELTSDIAAEAFQLRLASGDPTDVFMSALATSVTADEMIDSGMILELHDLILENMPDYMAYADENPDFAESLGTESTEGNWGGPGVLPGWRTGIIIVFYPECQSLGTPVFSVHR